ncbi:MAG: chromosomal replication initiator protein DnaA [Candidatus Microsyncoccus archaeolyticus]|nr:MAG: chromosomal replication initiator protein DnaA [Candidatus Parcubacteria bacterium]
MELENLWQTVLAQIQLNISPANFATWFNNTKIISLEDDVITVSVPNSFSKEWLEQKYSKDILKIIHSIDNNIKSIAFVVDPGKTKKITSSKKTVSKDDILTEQLGFGELEVNKETNLNPRYTFENFIVGPFNEMCYAAAMAVVEEPGKNYNPLFIYGGVGLGKTHLVQAIGNKIKEENPEKKVKYLPAEKLISIIVNSIKNHNIEELKKNLRELDVLIVDDIQFIAGKDKTQEEFFHTFNSLYQKNKQIILSSDRHPNTIPAITERLKSRFKGGMISDVSSPDYETRIAILRKKTEEKGVEISKEILDYMANNIQRNIRELESALNRLIIFKKANNKNPSLEDAKKLLKNLIVSPSKITNYKKIIQSVTEFYDIPNGNLFFTSRKKEFSKPRQMAMYLLKKELKMSYSEIGRKFGGKDHTTVIHSCQLIEKEGEESEKTNQEIELILQRIYSN